jgi:hypothetical protein
VTIVTEQHHDAVLVPNAALSFAQSTDALLGPAQVVVLRNGAPGPVQVQLGSSDGHNTQVLSGLSGGEQVIVGSEAPTTGGSSFRLPVGPGAGGAPANDGRMGP